MATSQCLLCGGAYEFDPSTFEESGRSEVHILGQTITCPHCGGETAVTMPIPQTPIVKLPSVNRMKIKTALRWGGLVLLLIIALVLYRQHYVNIMRSFSGFNAAP